MERWISERIDCFYPPDLISNVDFDGSFVLCGWLLFSKTFFEVIGYFVRSSLVSGLFARRIRPLALMVFTNRVPFCISNSERSGQSTGCLGLRADKFSITSLVLLSFVSFVA